MITVQIVGAFTGHDRKEWDPSKPGELEKIREFFKEKLKAGFQAFAFPKDSDTGRLITEFDEEAERIILSSSRIKVTQPPTRG